MRIELACEEAGELSRKAVAGENRMTPEVAHVQPISPIWKEYRSATFFFHATKRSNVLKLRYIGRKQHEAE